MKITLHDLVILSRTACQLLLIALSLTGDAHSLASQSDLTLQDRTAQCNHILDSSRAMSTCSSLVGSNWNCVNYAGSSSFSVSQLSAEHQHQLVMMCGDSAPLFCCPVWAMIRCLLQVVKDKCDQGQDFLHHYRTVNFEAGIEQLQGDRCVNFTFNSIECDNVFTYVKDHRLLERVAHKYGLVQYFFSSAIGSNITKLVEFKLSRTRGRSGGQNSSLLMSWLLIAITSMASLYRIIPLLTHHYIT